MSAQARKAPRPLTLEEMRLLRWMLERGSEDLRSYLPQLEGMRAASNCDCGCPSIQLAPSDSAPPGINRGERIVGEFVGVTVNGDSIGIIIFQDDGRLSELEVYPFGNLENKSPEFNFPKIETLKSN